jgi:hypothetical protein
LKNFDKLIFNLERQKREIELEKRILIWELYSKIEDFYNKVWDKI